MKTTSASEPLEGDPMGTILGLIQGFYWGLYCDNGKENGSYCNGVTYGLGGDRIRLSL